MPDTIRTLSELQTLFANNFVGDISAQDLRDFLVTAYDWAVTKGAQLATANTFTVGPQTILTGGNSNKGLIVRGNSVSQSANLQEWQNSSGTALVSINSNGSVIDTPVNCSIGDNGNIGGQIVIGSGSVKMRPTSLSSDVFSLGTQGISITGGVGGSVALLAVTRADDAIAQPVGQFNCGSSIHKGVVIKSTTSQSGNLLECQDSNGNVYSTVSENGYFTTRKNSAPADAELATSEAAYWFDNTNGAAKFMVKAKTADGTVVTGSITLT